jgi:hypothetical protein
MNWINIRRLLHRLVFGGVGVAVPALARAAKHNKISTIYFLMCSLFVGALFTRHPVEAPDKLKLIKTLYSGALDSQRKEMKEKFICAGLSGCVCNMAARAKNVRRQVILTTVST